MVRREAFLQAKQLPDLTDFIRFQMSSTLKLFPNQLNAHIRNEKLSGSAGPWEDND